MLLLIPFLRNHEFFIWMNLKCLSVSIIVSVKKIHPLNYCSQHKNGGDFRAIKPLQIAPENAGNRISEALKLKIFRGSMPPDPPRGYRLRRAFIRTPLRQILDPPQQPTPSLAYTWKSSGVWLQSLWTKVQPTFPCSGSLRIGTHNINVVAVQSSTFIHSNIQACMEAFSQFSLSVLSQIVTRLPIFILFIAYMYDHYYALSTVNTYVSALGFSHK